MVFLWGRVGGGAANHGLAFQGYCISSIGILAVILDAQGRDRVLVFDLTDHYTYRGFTFTFS